MNARRIPLHCDDISFYDELDALLQFNRTYIYAVLATSGALDPECVHYRLKWAVKGVVSYSHFMHGLVTQPAWPFSKRPRSAPVSRVPDTQLQSALDDITVPAAVCRHPSHIYSPARWQLKRPRSAGRATAALLRACRSRASSGGFVTPAPPLPRCAARDATAP